MTPKDIEKIKQQAYEEGLNLGFFIFFFFHNFFVFIFIRLKEKFVSIK